jgi:glycosyltransferase involved in cell wall biosynthesis
MSHGLPIVTTRIGGNPEVVTDGEHGLLVPIEDPDALAAALARLAEDPALRRTFGEAGRKRVEKEFTFVEMTRRYQAIYDRLVK